MFYRRIRSLFRNKDLGLLEGLNSLIPGKNRQSDIFAFRVLFLFLALGLLVTVVFEVYNLLNHWLTLVVAY